MIAYHAGVWDLLHVGHVRVLQASKAHCDVLIVGVVTDDGAAAYKRRPIVPEHERLELVRELSCVDAAFLQPGTDPTPVLEDLHRLGVTPDEMHHGDDWSELREGAATLQRLGIDLRLLPYGDGPGTTGLIERIRAREA
ncbi:MAG: adenylyltransferase/cytidyltransferase family protein [Myxococcota bacterium]